MQVLTSAVGGIAGPLVFAAAGQAYGYPWVYTADAFVILAVTQLYGLTLLARFRTQHPPACLGARGDEKRVD